MDWDDSLGLGSDRFFHLGWANVESTRVHVYKDRDAANIGYRIDRCRPCYSGGYDLASLLDVVWNGVVGQHREGEEVC